VVKVTSLVRGIMIISGGFFIDFSFLSYFLSFFISFFFFFFFVILLGYKVSWYGRCFFSTA